MIPTHNKTNKGKYSNSEQSCGVLDNVPSVSVGLSYIYICIFNSVSIHFLYQCV